MFDPHMEVVLLEDMFEVAGLREFLSNDEDFYFFAHFTPCNVRKPPLSGTYREAFASIGEW